MATAGERFRMPDGSVYIVRRPASETDGESVEMEFVLPSGCVPPPPHIHPRQEEEYEVLEGRFDVVVDGEWRALARGESPTVPIGALHTFDARPRANARAPSNGGSGARRTVASHSRSLNVDMLRLTSIEPAR
jgi:quercetin dioxygenase-like cupin family protein